MNDFQTTNKKEGGFIFGGSDFSLRKRETLRHNRQLPNRGWRSFFKKELRHSVHRLFFCFSKSIFIIAYSRQFFSKKYLRFSFLCQFFSKNNFVLAFCVSFFQKVTSLNMSYKANVFQDNFLIELSNSFYAKETQILFPPFFKKKGLCSRRLRSNTSQVNFTVPLKIMLKI